MAGVTLQLSISGLEIMRESESIRMDRKVAEDNEKTSLVKATGDGMIVAGRRFTNLDGSYASFSLDELLLFNSMLNAEDVNAIYSLV